SVAIRHLPSPPPCPELGQEGDERSEQPSDGRNPTPENSMLSIATPLLTGWRPECENTDSRSECESTSDEKRRRPAHYRDEPADARTGEDAAHDLNGVQRRVVRRGVALAVVIGDNAR